MIIIAIIFLAVVLLITQYAIAMVMQRVERIERHLGINQRRGQ